MTKAINSSQPALRLMGLDDCSLRASAPSLRAFTSSNIVPASVVYVSTQAMVDIRFTHRSISPSVQSGQVLRPKGLISLSSFVQMIMNMDKTQHPHPRFGEYAGMWRIYRMHQAMTQSHLEVSRALRTLMTIRCSFPRSLK